MEADRKSSLAEVASVFLRLGFTAFGGPAAHIAMMRSLLVTQRQWLSDEEFWPAPGSAGCPGDVEAHRRRGGAVAEIVSNGTPCGAIKE